MDLILAGVAPQLVEGLAEILPPLELKVIGRVLVFEQEILLIQAASTPTEAVGDLLITTGFDPQPPAAWVWLVFLVSVSVLGMGVCGYLAGRLDPTHLKFNLTLALYVHSFLIAMAVGEADLIALTESITSEEIEVSSTVALLWKGGVFLAQILFDAVVVLISRAHRLAPSRYRPAHPGRCVSYCVSSAPSGYHIGGSRVLRDNGQSPGMAGRMREIGPSWPRLQSRCSPS